jgi:hypothetical protein
MKWQTLLAWTLACTPSDYVRKMEGKPFKVILDDKTLLFFGIST